MAQAGMLRKVPNPRSPHHAAVSITVAIYVCGGDTLGECGGPGWGTQAMGYGRGAARGREAPC